MALICQPISLREANAFVAALHRHHTPARGCKFTLACAEGARLVGVAVCGRPVARQVDHRAVLEVTRLCTDGTRNACSLLYAAAARIAKEMGYQKIQTYILADEPGISLRAAGWQLESRTSGGSWSRTARTRTDPNPTVEKQRWARSL